jgi:hypothetical protein
MSGIQRLPLNLGILDELQPHPANSIILRSLIPFPLHVTGTTVKQPADAGSAKVPNATKLLTLLVDHSYTHV